jgi:hypothetical protein
VRAASRSPQIFPEKNTSTEGCPVPIDDVVTALRSELDLVKRAIAALEEYQETSPRGEDPDEAAGSQGDAGKGVGA